MFVSNTPTSTSHNMKIVLQKGEARTFRVLLRPVEAGALTWRFRFHNGVDSTWDDGSESWEGLPGGRFEIVSTSVCAEADGALGAFAPVTWGGAAGRAVGPDEWAVSDPVALEVAPGGHIAFTWCLRALEEGAFLPATPDSRALCYTAPGEAAFAPMSAFREEDETCLPDAFEADRAVRYRMAFMGDSITQGVQTRVDACEQWAARIALGIGRDVAVWNIGLGYGRAADAAKNGAWLRKAAEADVVNLCFGVNDLLHGSRNAETLANDLRAAVAALKARNPRAKAVLFTIPPFDLTGEDEARWRAVNARIRGGDHLGADAVFDIARILGREAPEDNMAFFGGHPDGRGGAAAAGEYLSAFWPARRDGLLPA
ncbi:MAG: SGNH/GDSL hydrolase family protein [Clostridia bacterium]|nr:SGNH/GDSL hydrolase family protein [Clostridia bacterium]